MQSLEQKRAKAAWAVIEKLRTESELRAEIENLPTLLAVNGLIPVLLRLGSKSRETKKNGSKAANRIGEVRSGLQEWLVSKDCTAGMDDLEADRVAQWLVDADGVTYRRATREAILFANWLKKWAQAYIPKPDSSGGKSSQPEPATGADHADQ